MTVRSKELRRRRGRGLERLSPLLLAWKGKDALGSSREQPKKKRYGKKVKSKGRGGTLLSGLSGPKKESGKKVSLYEEALKKATKKKKEGRRTMLHIRHQRR